MKLLCWLALLTCLPVPAEDRLRYVIPAGTFANPSAKEQAAILTAICDGKAEDGLCDTCPQSSAPGGGFSLKHVIPGHFLAPGSTDAVATISGCEQMHASVGWGYLLTRRDGNWESLDEVLGVELGNCHPMRFRDGRQLLVCEDYRMESFELMHNVTAMFAKDNSLVFRNLLTATDTTRLCDPQDRLQKARIDRIEFRDLNGDGAEDISITASLGSMPDSKRRQQLCEAAENAGHGVHRPEPATFKSYKIEYLFDGQQFTLTKSSEAAAALFTPVN